MLKKIIIGAAFSALIASSAMAQSYQPEWGSGNIVPGPNGGFVSAPYDGARFGGPGAYSGGPYAYERPAVHHRYRHHTNRQRYNN